MTDTVTKLGTAAACAVAVCALIWLGSEHLGVAGTAAPVIDDVPPRLVVRASTPGALSPQALRDALSAAGMAAGGALWTRLPAPDDTDAAAPARPTDAWRPDPAIEIDSAEMRRASALDPVLRIDRLGRIGGEIALTLDLPDHGLLTDQIALPLAARRLEQHARSLDAQVLARRLRRDGTTVGLRWIIAETPGADPPELVPRPRLEVPALPLRAPPTDSENSENGAELLASPPRTAT